MTLELFTMKSVDIDLAKVPGFAKKLHDVADGILALHGATDLSDEVKENQIADYMNSCFP